MWVSQHRCPHGHHRVLTHPHKRKKRVLYKHETTNKQHSVLALLTRKGVAERLVGLENSNLRISFDSFETFRLENKIYGFVQYQVVANVVERC